jgi:uncharacterized protein (DUF885 family)
MRSMKIAYHLLAAASAFALAIPVSAGPPEDLKRIIDQHWAWFLANAPVYASALGTRNYDDKIGDISLANADKQAGEAKSFAARLSGIPDAGLSPADRTNKGVLLRVLNEQVEANGFGQRMMLFSTYDGWHQAFAGMADGLPFKNKHDYESYLTRLAQYPQLNGTAIAISRRAVAEGYVQPCVALGGFENTITGATAGPPEKTRFFEPFTRNRPATISEPEWAAMQTAALSVITSILIPEYTKFYNFYVREYKPKCAKSVGISAQPGGKVYYAFQVRSHTTTDLTPDQIHNIGLSEVARIRSRMDRVAKEAGFMSREAMIAELRTNPKYFAKTSGELMAMAAAMAKLIDGKMPQYFHTLPRLPYGIRQIPAETAETTTTAYYNPGKPDVGIAGFYYVNTSKLSQRPIWELPALTLHEAVPGHHNQIALQQELDLPAFRKYATGFTAFVEGWGLYAEYLGEEMGMYDTPEKMMGRLSYEMWRACRLVVDTGMHAQGWSKERAIAYMKENTALTNANIEAEVNRYISWPGQALGYKIGEIKIRELRARAEAALGDKFELPRFHDAVLMQGAVPLSVLDQQINNWIAAEKSK